MLDTRTSDNISIRWIIILLVVIIATIGVLLLINFPSRINEIWLWIVGLIGPIIAFFRRITEGISNFFYRDKREENRQLAEEKKAYKQETLNLNSKITDLENQLAALNSVSNDFDGITITVLRYFDDGETTLGILFLDNKYFCYTLEDTFQDKKILSKTRIPGGIYKLNYRRESTPLTEKYRKTRPWFEYHLEIKNVKNFTGIYIHCGSTHEHTDGCLLIARSINSSDVKRSIYNSRETFEEFYKLLKPKLDSGEYARIRILDEEAWFKQKVT